jgi:hypothetical protein
VSRKAVVGNNASRRIGHHSYGVMIHTFMIMVIKHAEQINSCEAVRNSLSPEADI